ncbi:MAG: hypothetical protein OEV21_05735 [Thermoplasmata archaeon]|nr:hypothetical protein [Thermoplasmata archaeon]
MAISTNGPMLKIFVKFIIDSDGESPKNLVERLRAMGGVALVGEYDVEIPLGETERLFPKLDEIHRALKGSGALYTVDTGVSHGEDNKFETTGEHRIPEIRKKVYLAKLARWKEMGIDIKPLEELLETDFERFKEVSKTYLREHLDKAQIVADVTENLKKVDAVVYSSVDDLGVTIESICRVCGVDEHDAILSLARLIAAGRVTRTMLGDNEVYARVKKTRTVWEERPESTPATSSIEAEERVLKAIHAKGSTFKRICKISQLPEGQAMNALSELLNKDRVKSIRRGKNTVYIINKPES